MPRYHINRKGERGICKAKTVESCRANPPYGLDQIHGTPEEVDKALENTYESRWGFVRKSFKKLPEGFIPSEKLIGDPDTDHERLSVSAPAYQLDGQAHHIWFHDTEGRPMGFIKVVDDKDRDVIRLNDLEIRPEYRGNNLSKRLIKACEKSFGRKMIHEGGYTQTGFKALAPIFHSKEALEEYRKEYLYNDMTFVRNWDLEESEFPL